MNSVENNEQAPGSLTSSQQISFNNLVNKITQDYDSDPNSRGLGSQLYQFILNSISTTLINSAVYDWIVGAKNVNSDVGFEASFIRDYTADQVEERGITSGVSVQQASNLVAINFANDILRLNGVLPSIGDIGLLDAAGAAKTVFKGAEYPNGDYAGWAGTFLFPYLGVDSFYQSWLLNTNTVPIYKNTPGIYDLVAALEADGAAAASTVWIHPVDAIVAAAHGPSGATANPEALTPETNQFFGAYYSLPGGSSFLPGADLPFTQGFSTAAWNFSTSPCGRILPTSDRRRNLRLRSSWR